MLSRRDAGVNKIEFVDIDGPDYDPTQNAGISYEQVSMASPVSAACVLGLSIDNAFSQHL